MRHLLMIGTLLMSIQLFSQGPPKKPINPKTMLRAPLGADSIMVSDNNGGWRYESKPSGSQTLSFDGDDLSISGGNTVDLSPFYDNTDEQTLSMPSGGLEITGGNILDVISGEANNRLRYGLDNRLYVPPVPPITDGSGSGLDADFLDGQDGPFYLNYNNLNNLPTLPSPIWSQNGTTAYYNIGNVGIGNANPSHKLHVVGSTRIDGKLGIGRDPWPIAKYTISGHADDNITEAMFLPNPTVTGAEAKYLKGMLIYNRLWGSNISGNDNGYRIGFHSYSSLDGADNFTGSLHTLMGGWIQVGDNSSGGGTGAITNVTGLAINCYDSGSSTIGSKYGIYQTNANYYNYFQGRMGLNTTAPQNLLDVNGDAQFRGRVGIGTSSPLTPFHLYQNDGLTTSSGGLIEQDGTGDAKITYTLSGLQSWSNGIDNSDGDKYKISASTSLATSTRLTIEPLGNIGIGTTTPAELLDVAGNINLTGLLKFNTDDFEIDGSSFGHVWWVDGARKLGMKVTNSSNVYLGLFNGGGNAHEGGIHVWQFGAETRTKLELENGGSEGMVAMLKTDGANTHTIYNHPKMTSRTVATGSTTITAQDYTLRLNGAGFAITANLPPLSDPTIEDDDVFIFKCTDATNAVQVVANGSDLIDGSSSITFAVNEAYWLAADKLAGIWRIMCKY